MAYCQNCGAKLEGSSKFCGACGSFLKGTIANSPTKEQKKDHTRFIVVTVAIVVGALALIALLLYFKVHLLLLRLIAWVWAFWWYN